MSELKENRESNKLYKIQNGYKTEEIRIEESGSHLVQFLVGISACICMIGVGTHRAWTSPSLPYLKTSNSNFLITDTQGTWIVSLLLIGDLLGSTISPPFIDHIGRKYTIIIFTIPTLISWFLIIFAKNYLYLYIARFLAGIHQGCIVNSFIIYISEIAEKNIRGTLVNFMRIAASLGYFLLSTFAAFLPFKIYNLLCLFIPTVFLVISFFLPETPYFYFMHNRNEEGVRSLMRLRSISDSKSLYSEINEIKLTILENQKSNKTALRKLLKNEKNRRDLWIIFLMMVTQLFSGILAVNYYTEEILSFSGFSLDPGIQVMIVTGITVIACVSATIVIDRFERRTLFLYSGLLCAFSLGQLGIFFFMKLYLRINVSSVSWLPLLGLVMYKVSYSLGIGPIPDIMQGELFPVDVKATAISFGVVTTSIFCFITTAGYEVLNKTAGIYTTFLFFAISAIVGPILVFLVTPKTKGKTLEEIQAMRNPIRDKMKS